MQVKTGYLAVGVLAGVSNGTQEGIAEFRPQCRRGEGSRHVRVLFFETEKVSPNIPAGVLEMSGIRRTALDVDSG